jgi:hypothetical protein
MKRITSAAAGVAAVAIATGTVLATSGSGAATPPPPEAIPIAEVEGDALKAAAQDGEAHPSAMAIARGTFAQADAIMSGRGSSMLVLRANEPAYLVQLRGRFHLNAPRPPGAAEPTGTVLELARPAERGEVGWWGTALWPSGGPDYRTLAGITPIPGAASTARVKAVYEITPAVIGTGLIIVDHKRIRLKVGTHRICHQRVKVRAYRIRAVRCR